MNTKANTKSIHAPSPSSSTFATTRWLPAIGAGALLLSTSACVDEDEILDTVGFDESEDEELDDLELTESTPEAEGHTPEGPSELASGTVPNSEPVLYENASDITIAQTFRPRINFKSSHNCFPLDFKEIASNASDAQRDDLRERCNGSFDPNFVVFASVRRPQNWPNFADESFRVTYGVAFGWQESHLNDTEEELYDFFTGEGDKGSHGDDAQYVVVDVVNGEFNSAWADLHQGSYTRVESMLTMYNANQVEVWAGKWYNSLKLVSDTTTTCGLWNEIPSELRTICGVECYFGNTCGVGDAGMNFGDPVGSDHADQTGKLVMVEDVCATVGTSYTSPDNITYSGTQLEALKAYIGCDGENTDGVWDGYFMEKDQYLDPYGLPGCDSGNTDGGDICWASTYGSNATWRSFSGTNRYVEPATVGSADVDYEAGVPFVDLLTIATKPSSITIRGGDRVDQVSVTYQNGTTKSRGGQGGSVYTISDLVDDPVVSVYMCEATTGGEVRAGKIKLTTESGRVLTAGQGTSDCKTIAPANKRLLGFYGRSGSELDLLGTYWGQL